MKLTIGQEFKTDWGIWVLTATTDGSDFTCDNCGAEWNDRGMRVPCQSATTGG